MDNNYKIKDKKLFDGIQIYAWCFILFLVFWGGLLRENYNADTLFHMVVDDANMLINIEVGRYIISLGDFILFQFGIRTTDIISITMLITFALFALAMTKLYLIFEEYAPKNPWAKLGWFLALELVFLNVLFAELLMFNQCCVYFALGYFMAVWGIERFIQRKYISMFLFLSIAVCCYQYTMIFASIIVATYICLKYKSKFSVRAVLEEVIGIFVCMGVGGLNYASIIIIAKMGLIVSFAKNASIGSISEKLGMMIRDFTELYKDSAGIFPNLWFPLLFAIAIWGLLLYSCITKKKMEQACFIFIVYVGSMLLLYVIPFIQSNAYFPPRMSFCFHLVHGMLVVMAFSVCDEEGKRALSYVSIGYLVIQLLFTQFIVSDRFVSRTLDEAYANMVYQEILRYEEETGIAVTGLAVREDAYSLDYYEEVSFTTDQLNERTMGQVTNTLLWYVSGRSFERIDMSDDIYALYFEGKNWDYFNLKEQLIILDDVAYWCVF